MRLKKVISGGQTGADRTGLECAKAMGLDTGGTAPKGYKTELGPDPSLKEFGLVEDTLEDYVPRTRLNVRNAQVTLWFGNTNSPGYWCTKKAIDDFNKPYKVNPTPLDMIEVANTYEVVNVAGNRLSKNPKVVQLVKDTFKAIENLS